MKKETKEKVTLLRALKSNLYLLRLAFRTCPGRIIGELTENICWRSRWIFVNIIFWEVILGYVEKGTPFKEVLPFLTGSIIFLLLTITVIVIYDSIFAEAGNHIIYEKLHKQMFEKAADVELECFENPEFYDKYMKATAQIKGRTMRVIWNVCWLTGGVLSLGYCIYKAVRIDPFVLVFAVFPMVSTFVTGKRVNQANYKMYQENVAANRRKEYVKRSMYQQDYAKELRLSNAFLLLMHYFKDAVGEVVRNTKKYGIKVGLLSCLSEGLNQVFTAAGSILYASIRLLYFQNIRVSEYIVLVNVVSQISLLLVQNAQYLARLEDNHLYIQNIKEFFDYKPKLSESQPGRAVDREKLLLQMEHVSFSYLGQEREVLKDISLSIAKKEKIVLVGENGAGKSTLVKLLMRLYDPDKGQIKLNGTDVREYGVKEYRSLFGTVFQDFRIFGLTVAENVLMRRMKEEDRKTVEEALKNSGVYEKIMSLPNGIDTVLTREFDPEGAVLSGGESQKVAIARVFAKDCEIAVLDEPSSALDPVAEYQIYESMLKACRDKAVIFISHRLSTAVLADRIYMLEDGRIVESGSHRELMARNGKYAEMFRFQAGNYVGEVS